MVKQFLRSLKGATFERYTDLQAWSIDSWDQLEREFLTRFYSTRADCQHFRTCSNDAKQRRTCCRVHRTLEEPRAQLQRTNKRSLFHWHVHTRHILGITLQSLSKYASLIWRVGDMCPWPGDPNWKAWELLNQWSMWQERSQKRNKEGLQDR